MASEDIDKLCYIFHKVPIEKLQSIDDQNWSWLLPIKGLNLSGAVDFIRCSLKAVQDEQERLHRTATLYAWLVPRGVYKSWALYRLEEFLATLDASEIGEKLVEAFRSRESVATYGVFEDGNTFSLTILIPQFPSAYMPVCFHVWRGLPFLAVHAVGMTPLQARKWPALAFVLGNLEQCSPSMYDELERAHSVAEFSKPYLSDCFT